MPQIYELSFSISVVSFAVEGESVALQYEQLDHDGHPVTVMQYPSGRLMWAARSESDQTVHLRSYSMMQVIEETFTRVVVRFLQA